MFGTNIIIGVQVVHVINIVIIAFANGVIAGHTGKLITGDNH
jgi:hypothetical protein